MVSFPLPLSRFPLPLSPFPLPLSPCAFTFTFTTVTVTVTIAVTVQLFFVAVLVSRSAPAATFLVPFTTTTQACRHGDQIEERVCWQEEEVEAAHQEHVCAPPVGQLVCNATVVVGVQIEPGDGAVWHPCHRSQPHRETNQVGSGVHHRTGSSQKEHHHYHKEEENEEESGCQGSDEERVQHKRHAYRCLQQWEGCWC